MIIKFNSREQNQIRKKIIYRIVASTNTCSYSENQVFGGVTTGDLFIDSKILDFEIAVSNMGHSMQIIDIISIT